jgi:hypothetical protein
VHDRTSFLHHAGSGAAADRQCSTFNTGLSMLKPRILYPSCSHHLIDMPVTLTLPWRPHLRGMIDD